MSNDQKTDKNKTIQPTAYKYFQLSLSVSVSVIHATNL